MGESSRCNAPAALGPPSKGSISGICELGSWGGFWVASVPFGVAIVVMGASQVLIIKKTTVVMTRGLESITAELDILGASKLVHGLETKGVERTVEKRAAGSLLSPQQI